MRKRLDVLAEQLIPKKRRSYALQQLCRLMWRQDKQGFIDIARDGCLRSFIEQFEREDADRHF
jgi:hypothetical protein